MQLNDLQARPFGKHVSDLDGVLQYDKNHSGALEFEELRSVLADLGMLVIRPPHPQLVARSQNESPVSH